MKNYVYNNFPRLKFYSYIFARSPPIASICSVNAYTIKLTPEPLKSWLLIMRKILFTFDN